MRDLMPPRTFSVTFAAVLSIITGFYWLTATATLLMWVHDRGVQLHGLRLTQFGMLVFAGCGGAGAVIGGFGILFRRNWARILAIVSAVPLIFLGLWDLYGLLRLRAPVLRSEYILTPVVLTVLPLLAAIAWLVLFIGKKVRAEFLPPAVVAIYVNLMNETVPRARLTQASTLGNGLFELLATKEYDPAVEDWEFRPGSIVRGKEERRDGKAYLLATSFER
jgi:hypothetical protein